MQRLFENQVIMITGAARGQGYNHAVAFAELGAKLIICDVCEDIKGVGYPLADKHAFDSLTKELVEKTDHQVIAHTCDVRNPHSVNQVVKMACERFGKIDVLVNNAGVCKIQPAWEISVDDWNAMLDINLTGTWNCCRAVIPIMKAQNKGKILMIGSIAGLKGIPNLSHYVAAKHGVVGLTKGLAIDLAPYGIHVNCICPGSVDTPMLEGLAPQIGQLPEEAKRLFAEYHLLPGLIQPADITGLVLWLASKNADSVTGAVWNIDQGWLQN